MTIIMKIQLQHTIKKGKLEDVENHEKRKEGIKMNIKGITPLHILALFGHHYQVTIGDEPVKFELINYLSIWLVKIYQNVNLTVNTCQNRVAIRSPTPMQSTNTTQKRNFRNPKTGSLSTTAKPIDDAETEIIISKKVSVLQIS